ncbi:MAG: response regulator transcription factor [Acidimicrobiaceae bacterium]|nr:response regulator transcription factor [Acidimicrobiaceae bacterium]MYH77984.1 response regulator transcription factor [Acidimicrobiaceae bacterium]
MTVGAWPAVRREEEPVVVLVEDDPNIASLVDMYLRQDGYRVFQASDGSTGLDLIKQHRPKIVILDIGLPGDVDGIQLCRELRASSDVPVIMLTARDGEIDRIVGLELGADDYVTKPFSPRELVARVRAVLRRSGSASRATSPPILEVGEVEVDTARREVRLRGDPVSLTAREFDLLQYLAENLGLALSRRQLLDGVWGYDWVGDERTVDVHVLQLRKKLGETLRVTTVRGVGYRLD